MSRMCVSAYLPPQAIYQRRTTRHTQLQITSGPSIKSSPDHILQSSFCGHLIVVFILRCALTVDSRASGASEDHDTVVDSRAPVAKPWAGRDPLRLQSHQAICQNSPTTSPAMADWLWYTCLRCQLRPGHAAAPRGQVTHPKIVGQIRSRILWVAAAASEDHQLQL